MVALVTVALGSFTVQNEIMANEGSENIASSIDANTHEGSRSRGGPFALETRNATSREASAGGAFDESLPGMPRDAVFLSSGTEAVPQRVGV